MESDTNFAIEWTSKFEISEDLFIISDRSGRMRALIGYPVGQIAEACGLND